MAPSKTLPGTNRDLNGPSTTASSATSRITSTASASGCPHTTALLSANPAKVLRAYELAIRVSLQQAVAAASVASSSSSTSSSSTKNNSNGSSSSAKKGQSNGVSKGTRKKGTSSTAAASAATTTTAVLAPTRHLPKFLALCPACHAPPTTTLLACLHCPSAATTACLAHFVADHHRTTGHCIAVDLVTGWEGLVYCAACADYVVVDQMEEVRRKKVAQFLGLGVAKGMNAGPVSLDFSNGGVNGMVVARAKAAPPPPFQAMSALRGFCNMGATCFMSVIFQSLIHNPLVRNFFLAGGHERGVRCGVDPAAGAANGGGGVLGGGDDDTTASSTPAPGAAAGAKDSAASNCLACALDDVFAEFYTSSSVAGYGPTNLLTSSWRVKRSLAGYSEQDAHEFLQMVLNELHAAHYESGVLERGSEAAMGLPGLASFSRSAANAGKGPEEERESGSREERCGCISHRTFGGELESQITCQTCGTVASTVCDPMMDMSLEIGSLASSSSLSTTVAAGKGGKPLATPVPTPPPKSGSATPKLASTPKQPGTPSAATGAGTAGQAGLAGQGSVTLEQCLDRFTAGETLDATFKCVACNMKRPIQKRLLIKRLPAVLSIQLKVCFFIFFHQPH